MAAWRTETVKGILADINIGGHVDYLVSLMQLGTWNSIWSELNLQYARFGDVGLAPDAKDSAIWQFCQADGYVLITGNRNEDDIDSLQATIRARNTAQSLPVLTVSDPERLRKDREYADRLIESLLDALLDIESLRGTGRLYIP
jgi:hypothetical protein